MTTDAAVEGILDDIVSSSDNFLYGILADALEDKGDPRSELVRLTWSLREEPDHPDFATRQGRVQELLLGGMVPVVPRRTFGGIEFAYIPPGSFLMGSPETEKDRSDDEERHPVKLTRGFFMGITPVTQSQWQAVMGNNPSWFSRGGGGKDAVKSLSHADVARLPVEQVSWDDAQAFCKKLGERLGKRIQLPTEAQWEYACRAGTTTPFHFGGVLRGDLANHDGNYPYGTRKQGTYVQRTTPVGSYPANPWGLFDTHGNIWEWCQDAYRADYQTLANENPLNVFGSRRVVRGGSWGYGSVDCRAAFRLNFAPGNRSYIIGFRVVVLP